PTFRPIPEPGNQLLVFGQVGGEEPGSEPARQPQGGPENQCSYDGSGRPQSDRHRPSPGPYRGVTDRFEPEVIGPECAQSGEDEVDRQRRSQEVENSSATITGSSTGRRGPLEHPGDCKETVPQPRS